MPKFRCNKLGRDKGIESFQSQGVTSLYQLLSGHQLQDALKNKMIEEAIEVQEVQSKEELTSGLADVLEVIDGLCLAHGITMQDVLRIKEHKYHERGGFEKGFYLQSVEMDENNPRAKHFRASPEKYPEE